jgi:hypothetical protein
MSSSQADVRRLSSTANSATDMNVFALKAGCAGGAV